MAVDKKISQLDSGAPAQAGDEYVVARSGANYKLTLTNIAASMPPIGATTPNTGSFTSLTNSGNLTFSSTGQRITGDMSNATVANRLMFQGSVANATTFVGLIPNGTGTTSSINCFGNSDPTNAAFVRLLQNSTNDSQIRSDITGTGTYVPMTFHTSGSERMRLDTSGNLGLGVTPSAWSGGPNNSNFNMLANSYIANAGSFFGLNNNAFYGGAWKYIANDFASQYLQYQGSHIWSNAPSGTAGNNITFTERMRINSSGNVGIGTASPGALLHVSNASAKVRIGLTAGTEYTDIYRDSATGYTIYNAAQAATFRGHIFQLGGTEAFRIDSSGNVGIGTASPQSKLNVVESSSSTSIGGSTAVLQVGNSNGASLNLTAGIELFGSGAPSSGLNNRSAGLYGVYEAYNASGNAGALVLATNPAGTTSVVERMRIDSSGNVGIGTTSAGGFNGTVNLGGSGNPASGYLEGWGNTQSIPSSVTTRFDGFFSVATTAAASFTLPELRHFTAQGSTKGAGSTVTSQFGFYADSGLTTATNNYGFYSDIASGSNRWNFYAAGTALNYFAGDTLIGTSANATGITTRFLTKASSAYGAAAVFESDGSAANWARTDWKNANIATTGIIYIDQSGEFAIRNDGNYAIAFYTNGGNQRMRVKSTGQVRFVPLASDPSGAETGDVYYNSGTNKLKVYNGTSWVDLH